VRAALGESAKEPRAVRTVHRRGYAFQAAAQELADGETAAAGTGTGEADTSCWLVWSSGQVPLLSGENVVGRDPHARVWIDAPSVSRRHACIRVEGARVTIEDLGSKNGTRVGDAPVTAATSIADGAALRFGSVPAEFRARSADPTRTEGRSRWR